MDSNQRWTEPRDLQSPSFNHSDTYPNSLYLKTELRRSMGHLGFEPRTNRLKAGYSDQTELMSHKRFKFSRCWWSLNHLYRIPPFGLWRVTGGSLAELSQATKKGRKLLVSLPFLFAFYGSVLTSDLPYPQTGEHPQYANNGNRDY